jgi:hypothetical protein
LKKGMSGIKSTAKKKGRCASHRIAESASEPARRRRLS